MLVNKNKLELKQKKSKISIEDYEKSIESMESWIRKIEQTAYSISSRLSAVEKRISLRNSTPGIILTEENNLPQGQIKKVITEIYNGNNTKELVQISDAIDFELEQIQSDLISQERKFDQIKEKIELLNKSLEESKEEVKKIRDVQTKYLTDFKTRIEKIEKRAPYVMKIGRMEIPIELAGIIAGAITIFAAISISMNNTEILLSPLFLGIVGVLFIGSALLKAAKSM